MGYSFASPVQPGVVKNSLENAIEPGFYIQQPEAKQVSNCIAPCLHGSLEWMSYASMVTQAQVFAGMLP